MPLRLYPNDEAVAVENTEIGRKPLVKRLCLISESLLHRYTKLSDAVFAVNQRPEEAPRFVKVNITYLGASEKLLCDSVEESFVFDFQSYDSVIPRTPFNGVRASGYFLKVILWNYGTFFLHCTGLLFRLLFPQTEFKKAEDNKCEQYDASYILRPYGEIQNAGDIDD